MRIKLSQTHTVLSAFSYSSLTDIVLLLLIFFLLTSSFIATKGLSVSLPGAQHAASMDATRVTVTLTRAGGLFIDGRLIDAAQFAEELRRACPDPAKASVALWSDKDVPLERAVFVMDAARGIGIPRVTISTIAKDTDAARR